ncbi:MAG: hypothetical protein EBX55_12380, partial [Betaproteobacteria bacterium]|nr:hypothetical protein [Betaproteobacteria bacterium]
MNRLMLLAISIPLLGLLVLSSLFIVDQRQYAAVYALGEIKRVIETPGLHFKLPPPFQNVTYFDKRILTIDTPDTDRFITSEKLNLQVDSFVKWRIVDVKAFIRSVSGSQSIAADRLLRSLRDAMNIEISKITVAELISGEREKIVEELRNKLNDAAKEIGAEIDWMNESLKPLDSFILPGGSALSAHLHLARTVCRRAERDAIRAVEADKGLSAVALRYLNRLSDHLFVAARRANANGADDVKWKPGATRQG